MNNSVESTLPRKFDISGINGGYRVTFYCSAGDKKHTNEVCDSPSVEQALMAAWKEAKLFFNRCHQCGSWVCDDHYNEDVMKCTFCQPKK